MPTSRGSVFVSYSHQDARWLKRLQVHLAPLVRDESLELWDDTKIRPGANWREDIEQALSRARVAVMLVSADFLASEFIAQNELPPLLDKAARGGTVIFPVIVRHCMFSRTQALSKYQALNPPERPLDSMSKSDAEAVLLSLAHEVERVIKNP